MQRTFQVALAEPTCQCRRLKRCGLDPWVRKTPGGGHGHPLQLFLLGESLGQRTLASYSPKCRKKSTWLKSLSSHAHIDGVIGIIIDLILELTVPETNNCLLNTGENFPGQNQNPLILRIGNPIVILEKRDPVIIQFNLLLSKVMK